MGGGLRPQGGFLIRIIRYFGLKPGYGCRFGCAACAASLRLLFPNIRTEQKLLCLLRKDGCLYLSALHVQVTSSFLITPTPTRNLDATGVGNRKSSRDDSSSRLGGDTGSRRLRNS